jgi:hypothetical protein
MELNHISSKRNDSDRTNLDLSPLAIAMINLGYDISGWEDDCSLRNTILEEEDIVWDGTDAFDPDDEFSEKTPKKPLGDTLQNYFKQLTDFKFIQNIKDNPKIFGGVVALLVVFLVCLNNLPSGDKKSSDNIRKKQEQSITQKQEPSIVSSQEKNNNNRKRIARLIYEEGRRNDPGVYLGKFIYSPLKPDSELAPLLEKFLTGKTKTKLDNRETIELEVMVTTAMRTLIKNSSAPGPMLLTLFATEDNYDLKGFVTWHVLESDERLIIYDPFVRKPYSKYNEQFDTMLKRTSLMKQEIAKKEAEKRKEELAKANSARDAFINFHRSITNRQLRSAFDILSPDYQRFMGSYDRFARGYDTTLRSDVVELNTIQEDNNSATFAYKLKAVDREGSGQKVQYFAGKAKLVKINGQWRIDSTEAKRVSQSSTAPNMAKSRIGTITGNDVNVRKGPGIDYKSLGFFYKGDKVRVVDSNRNSVNETWYKIEFDNPTAGLIVGWVRSDFIRIN